MKIAFVGNRFYKLGSLIIASVMLVSSGCRTPVIPDGVYMADVGGSKITVAGDYAELDFSLEPEKNKRYVAQAMIDIALGRGGDQAILQGADRHALARGAAL